MDHPKLQIINFYFIMVKQQNQILNDESNIYDKYSWAISHSYPEYFPPQKIPDDYNFPTHMISPKMERTLNCDTGGKFVIAFQPNVSCFKPFSSMNNSLSSAFASDSFIWYADNNGTTVVSDAATVDVGTRELVYLTGATNNGKTQVNSLDEFSYTETGFSSQSYITRSRLVGAYLRIRYIGRTDSQSGIVKAALSFKQFSAPARGSDIFIDDLQNQVEYNVSTLKNPLTCRYRIANEEHVEFGPYNPYGSVPIFIVYGEGFASGAPIFVETVRHFECVIKPEFNEFARPLRNNPQLNYGDQKPVVIKSSIDSSKPNDKLIDDGKQLDL